MRVLIIRTSALGDIVHSLPVLVALRRRFPEAKIAWVVERAFAPLLLGHPDLDEVLVAELRAWRYGALRRRTLMEIGRFVASLQDFSPEIVLDLMGNHKAGVLAALSLADRRIGLHRTSRREPSSAVWINEPVATRGQHAVERALAVLEPLGVSQGEVDFGPEKLLPNPPAEAHRWLESCGGPYVLIHAGAGWGNKLYPARHWGEVARRLRDRCGLMIWVASGPGEEELGRRVVDASSGSCAHVSAPALAFLAALLRNARLVLGGDTGPVHMAHALGTPVLCLMGPTHPDRNGPYRNQDAAMWRELPCSFCHRRFSDTKACLLDLQPVEVAQRAEDLLAQQFGELGGGESMHGRGPD